MTAHDRKPVPGAEPGDWIRYAACAGRFDLTDATHGRKALLALQLCHSCPVLTQCEERVQQENGSYIGVAAAKVFLGRGQVKVLRGDRLVKAA